MSGEKYDFGNGFLIVKKEFPIEERLNIFNDSNGYDAISESRKKESGKATKWLMAKYKTERFNKDDIDNGVEDKIHTIFTLLHISRITPLYPTVNILDFKDDLSWKNASIRSMTSEFYLDKTQIKPEYNISINDLDKAKLMFNTMFKHLSIDFMEKNRIVRSISFYKHAIETYPKHLRFLNLTIAIESLLSTSRHELRYKISQRAAWLLGNDSKDKKDIFKKTKDIYDLRSTIVHGGALKQSDLTKLDELILLLEGYLRSAYVIILTDNKLFDIFMDTNKIDDYFKGIMFT